MASERRLLLLATSLGRGGAEQQVVDLATNLRARGWTVNVLSMIDENDHVSEFAAAGIEVGTLGMRRGVPSLGALLRYRSFLRRWRPDVVHSHMVHANLLARFGRLLAPGTPVVSTVHNVIEGREGTGGTRGSRQRELVYRLTDRLASATTAVSVAATDRYIRVGAVPRGRIETIPNGFDFSRTVVPPDAREAIRTELHAGAGFLWVTAGRLVSEKGHDLLLQAFGTVLQTRPDSHLAIAGAGPERDNLDRLVAELGLSNSVSMLGIRRDVPSLLAAADGFVLSSRVEGLPIVLLEAAAQGLPIVSTDVGGCREVASPELGAVIAATSAEGIADAMLRVMALAPDERARIGRALQEHVRTDYDLGADRRSLGAGLRRGRRPLSDPRILDAG